MLCSCREVYYSVFIDLKRLHTEKTLELHRMTWTLKNNVAVSRRLEKVGDVNLDTHEGRSAVGYCYFDYISEPQVISYEDEEE